MGDQCARLVGEMPVCPNPAVRGHMVYCCPKEETPCRLGPRPKSILAQVLVPKPFEARLLENDPVSNQTTATLIGSGFADYTNCDR